MAVVIGSTFKPFNYSDLLAPVQQATQSHQAVENAYGELDTKASVWEGLANQQTDPVAYNTYMKYSQDLREKAGMLASQGLTPSTARALNNMRARYASEIVPIENAYKRREELGKEQREYRMKNPSAIFDRDMSMASLDELVSNPSLQYRSLSGKDIMEQVSSAAKNLTRQVRENPAQWKSILGGQYYELLRNTGFRDSDVLAVLSQSEGASLILNKIMEDAVVSSGVMDWGSPQALEEVRRYAGQGLWSAIGSEDRKQLQNRIWDLDMKQRLEGPQEPDIPQLPFSRRPLAKVEIEESTSRMKKELDLIKEAVKDPSKLNKIPARTDIIGVGPMRVGSMGSIDSDHYKALKKWSERAGSKDPKVIEDYINREIRNSARLYADDIYTPADNKFLVRTLSDRLTALKDSDSKTTLIREYDPKNREVGSKPKKFSDMEEYLNDSSTLALDYNDNLIITGRNKKGKTESFALDPTVFDNSLTGVNISGILDEIRARRADNNSRAYMAGRMALFSQLNALLNSYSKIQGNTLGAKDPVPGEESYLSAIVNP